MHYRAARAKNEQDAAVVLYVQVPRTPACTHNSIVIAGTTKTPTCILNRSSDQCHGKYISSIWHAQCIIHEFPFSIPQKHH